jgi:hypothetical protein
MSKKPFKPSRIDGDNKSSKNKNKKSSNTIATTTNEDASVEDIDMTPALTLPEIDWNDHVDLKFRNLHC